MIDKASLSRLVSGLFLFGAAGLAAGANAAEPHESFAVVALVGDSITIVNYQGVTGSSIDRNIQTQVSLGDDHFDEVAARVALAEIHRLDPEAATKEIRLPDRGAYGDADALYSGDGKLPALLTAAKPLLATPDTHYLLVISKSRGEARLKMTNGSTGSGKLTGLGFYIDTYLRMKKTSTGQSGRGFIAPYAYLQVDLVDLRTGAATRTEKAIETTTRANVGPESNLDPWNALSAEEKVRLLDNLLTRAVRTAVAHVVAPG